MLTPSTTRLAPPKRITPLTLSLIHIFIAVPAQYAQDVADILAETKIQGILNFAPVVLTVPEEIETRNVDLAVNLEVLSFNIESSQRQH